MVSVLTTKNKETLGAVGYVFYFEHVDGIMDITYVQTHQIAHSMCSSPLTSYASNLLKMNLILRFNYIKHLCGSNISTLKQFLFRGLASTSVLPLSSLLFPIIILFVFDSSFCCCKKEMTFEQRFEEIEGAYYAWYFALCFFLLNDI